jgi:ElaB/YqjD/DUF883 family membrane-anchored ribosome-binding protein
MSDSFSQPLDPQEGFSTSPSVSKAASDLRDAAGALRDAATDRAREFAHEKSEQAKGASLRAVESAQHFRDTAMEKAQALKSAAVERATELRHTAGEKAAQIRTAADEQWHQTRDKAKELHITAEDYVRQHPTKCVLGALGVGFLIGLISRR